MRVDRGWTGLILRMGVPFANISYKTIACAPSSTIYTLVSIWHALEEIPKSSIPEAGFRRLKDFQMSPTYVPK